MKQLQTIDARFISDGTLEGLSAPARLGRSLVAGRDVNRVRVRRVIQAAVALAAQPDSSAAAISAASALDAATSTPAARKTPI